MTHRITVLAGLVAMAALGSRLASAAPNAMKVYPSRYYVIHSDLPADQVREASLRMTAMAEEYYNRTRGFSGKIDTRLDFFLFSDAKDYAAAGGAPGSAGQYDGKRLMATFGPQGTGWSWHVIQHEGFHQFAHTMMRARIPVWVNEGLADYFGDGVYTGDGFVTGVIPQGRLLLIKAMITSGKYKPFDEMMDVSPDAWRAELTAGTFNYQQAWSMVYFLAHGDDGKYQQAFDGFLKDSGRGDWKKSWRARFGSDVAAFEKMWAKWWLAQPANPTADLYNQAVAATMTSYLARAAAAGQKFQSADDFLAAAKDGKLKATALDWLPANLLETNLRRVDRGTWKLIPADASNKWPRLQWTLPDGPTFTGQFTLARDKIDLTKDRVDKVSVTMSKPTTQPAKN